MRRWHAMVVVGPWLGRGGNHGCGPYWRSRVELQNNPLPWMWSWADRGSLWEFQSCFIPTMNETHRARGLWGCLNLCWRLHSVFIIAQNKVRSYHKKRVDQTAGCVYIIYLDVTFKPLKLLIRYSANHLNINLIET